MEHLQSSQVDFAIVASKVPSNAVEFHAARYLQDKARRTGVTPINRLADFPDVVAQNELQDRDRCIRENEDKIRTLKAQVAQVLVSPCWFHITLTFVGTGIDKA